MVSFSPSLGVHKLTVNIHVPKKNFIKAHSGATVNQLLRRAAAAAAMRRERNNSSHSDELSLKRHRPDNGIPGNNNSPDVVNHMPQVTATDFSTIKHNNNNTPPIKDSERIENHSGMSSVCVCSFCQKELSDYVKRCDFSTKNSLIFFFE